MRILSILVLTVFWLTTVQAGPAAEEVIKTQTELLLSRLQVEETERNSEDSLELLVVETIGRHVDFPLFSRLVLGKHRKRLTPDEMTRFERGLTGVVIKTYAASLVGVSDLKISYLGVQKGKKNRRLTVLTSVKSADNPAVSIDYRLYEKDGQWKVYDVVIEGVSMMMNYRTVLSEKIKSEGIEAVICSFEANDEALAAS